VEAHGGYTYCGLAALELLHSTHKLNRESLVAWTLQRQMPLEGGFQGRTNKLVDGCYSFWVGGTQPVIDGIMYEMGRGIHYLIVYFRECL
jgi:protein farnesyltransferase subunit beta